MLTYCLMWVPSALNFLLIDWITAGQVEMPAGALQGSYLVLFVMGLFNLAIGCFASALTSNQIIAAVIAGCFVATVQCNSMMITKPRE